MKNQEYLVLTLALMTLVINVLGAAFTINRLYARHEKINRLHAQHDNEVQTKRGSFTSSKLNELLPAYALKSSILVDIFLAGASIVLKVFRSITEYKRER